MKSIRITILLLFIVLGISSCTRSFDLKDSQSQVGKNTDYTFVNSFTINEKGFPTRDSLNNIFDEMDYQRATIAYLWALPQMVSEGQFAMHKAYGVTDEMDFLKQYNDPSVLGMLTPNTVVEYMVNSADFTKTGPIVLEMPGGNLVGLMMDWQMHWSADLGLVGPKGAKAEKILFLGPDDKVPADSGGYRIERVLTNRSLLAVRVLQPKIDKDLDKKIRLYPWSERNNPKPNKIVQAKKDDAIVYIRPPAGMEYWKRLNEIVQFERVQTSDLYMMSHLKVIGIEKGKAFNPSEKQIKIMKRAAFVGEKMAMASSFASRSKAAKYRNDSRWVHPLMLNPDQISTDKSHKQFDERIDWFWEAYGLSPAMKAKVPGEGSTYLGAYRDDSGEWFDGGKHYSLHLAAKIPAKQFWEVTIYELQDRGIIVNGTDKTALNSFTKGLVTNADGSTDLYFGPSAPVGKESNWVKTNPGEYWFTYFRLYAPTEIYFDRSWVMHDIKEVK
jgi:hypothetical protein